MAVSDTVVGNLTMIYVAIIAGIKAYGLITGRSFSGGVVLISSTVVVGLILIGSLIWDVSRKAAAAAAAVCVISNKNHRVNEICSGGICWHGVAVRSPADEVRFRLPPQQRLYDAVL